MVKIQFQFFLVIVAFILLGCQPKETQIVISTKFGDIQAVLYNETPLHRDNFIKLAKSKYYDGLLFHRVIPNFMIQGGDPNSKNSSAGQILGSGGPGYQIDAEIGLPHLKGALAAARNNNPEKKSSGSQFYIVQGRPIDDRMLDYLQQQKNITYSEAQRELYKKEGGSPDLDMDYTVFGMVTEGMEIVEQIANVHRDNNDRPVEDIEMLVRVIK